jgi:hypothetical protein
MFTETTLLQLTVLARSFTSEAEFEEAEKMLERVSSDLAHAKRDFLRKAHAEALAKDSSARDVHTEHCSVRHGCKYGYDRLTDQERVEHGISDDKVCTVANGEKIASFFYDDEDEGY